MKDFTIQTYEKLLLALQPQGFEFLPFREFIKAQTGKVIVLRHDVDALPGNSLKFAELQARHGIKGSYYFRIVPKSYDENIIREIASMGHEIGYHYEDVSLAAKRQEKRGRKGEREKGGEDYERYLAEIAIESFRENLEKLRQIVPVTTICMHGSPTSRWDSRLLWKYYDYRDFGITGEPYFDIDFSEVLYLTDTGRRWDGDAFSIRDKAQGAGLRAQSNGHTEEGKTGRRGDGETEDEIKRRRDKNTSLSPTASHSLSHPFTHSPSHPLPLSHSFHSTFDIIRAAENGTLPNKIMMTFHPQRWTDKPVPWVQELVWQNVKNVGKYFLIRLTKEKTGRRGEGVTGRRVNWNRPPGGDAAQQQRGLG